jgi:hypothetical protein
MRCSRRPKGLIKRKSPKSPRATSLKLIRRSTTSMVPRLICVKEEAKTHSPGGHGGLTTTPEYLKWFEVPITFDRSDHLNFVPKSGWYPLIVRPIIKDFKLNRSTESSSMEVAP